jgi:iron-sulfur cluster insertion protein
MQESAATLDHTPWMQEETCPVSVYFILIQTKLVWHVIMVDQQTERWSHFKKRSGMTDVIDAAAEELQISERAAKRITDLIASESQEGLMLRVAVSGGGCSGFQYGFTLDGTLTEEDKTFSRDGIKVVIDDVSLDLLKGSEIDFTEDLIGSYFSIKNPNASSTCGCGTSFSL